MSTNWSEHKSSILFDEYDDFVESALGYNPIIDALKNNISRSAPIMDYGCGGGKVSSRLKAAGFSNISGFDISPTMVEKARARVGDGAVFAQVQSGEIPSEDNTFSAAICCYVFINVPDRDEIAKIANEIFRVLKPGAVFYLLDTNPRSSGIKFTTFQNGDAEVEYADGDDRNVYLDLPSGDVFEIVDTYWAHETYLMTLEKAGFRDVVANELMASDIDPEKARGISEREYSNPPFVFFSCRKPDQAEGASVQKGQS
jgi:ubiquinone/menaquinone biosynthesis C-methylase UbiE